MSLRISKSHREQGLDYREAEELSWCPSWSNSLWQGWSCGLVHCPSRNATHPIWRVLASSLGISRWTPLKPQHSNPNPNPLAYQLRCIDFLTPPNLSSSLIDSLPSFNLLCHSKSEARFMQVGRKVVWSIPYVSVAFFPSLEHNFIVLLKCRHVQIAFLKYTSCDNQTLAGSIPITAVDVHLKLKS